MEWRSRGEEQSSVSKSKIQFILNLQLCKSAGQSELKSNDSMLCLTAHLDVIELIVISACAAYVDRVHKPLATLSV